MSKKEIVETLKVEPRANFSSSTIEKLYKSNGGLCSRCGRMTTAYNHENLKYISIGEAGHIFGAKRTSDKSPRSNSTLTNDFLKNFENGIWLCKNCHKLIDDAEKDFSSDLLLKMKKKASSLAYDSLKRGIEFYELIQNDKYLINSVDFGTSYSSTEINGIKILNSVSLKGYDIYDDYHNIKSKSKLFKCFKELKQYYRKAYEELSEVHLIINNKNALKSAVNNALKLVSNIQTHIDVAINMFNAYNLQDFVDVLKIIKDNSYSIRFAMRWI